jgi:hypothetical protein
MLDTFLLFMLSGAVAFSTIAPLTRRGSLPTTAISITSPFLIFLLAFFVTTRQNDMLVKQRLIEHSFASYTVEEKTGKVTFVIPDTSLAKVFFDKDGKWR